MGCKKHEDILQGALKMSEELMWVSPVGQGLEGGVHVAGVAYILQPRQA